MQRKHQTITYCVKSVLDISACFLLSAFCLWLKSHSLLWKTGELCYLGLTFMEPWKLFVWLTSRTIALLIYGSGMWVLWEWFSNFSWISRGSGQNSFEILDQTFVFGRYSRISRGQIMATWNLRFSSSPFVLPHPFLSDSHLSYRFFHERNPGGEEIQLQTTTAVLDVASDWVSRLLFLCTWASFR